MHLFKRWFVAAGLLLSMISGFTTAQPADSVETFRQEADSFFKSVKAAFPELPGFSVAVVRGNETVFSSGYGMADMESSVPATDETAWYIASCTKSFSALTLALLSEQGLLDFDDPITKYFPVKTFPAEVNAEEVTIRDLVAHVSGLENDAVVFRTAYSGDHTNASMIDVLSVTERNLDAPHGTFEYTNFGYNLAGMIIDSVTGNPWQVMLDSLVFSSVGMRHTSAFASEVREKSWPMARPYSAFGPEGPERIYLEKADNTMHAAGGMYASVNDLARFVSLQLQHGRLDGKQVYPASLIWRTQTPIADANTSYGPFDRSGYAMGWYTGTFLNRRMLHHFGGFSGAHAHVSFIPDENMGLVMLFNESSTGSRIAALLAQFVYAWWLEEGTALDRANERRDQLLQQFEGVKQQVAANRVQRATREWKLSKAFPAYAGRYVNAGYGAFEVVPRGASLQITSGNLQATALPFTDDETVRVELVPGQGEVIQFILDDNGTITGFSYQNVFFEKVH